MFASTHLVDEARRIARVVSVLAAALAVVVAVSVPLGYFVTAWRYESLDVANATQQAAVRLSRHIFGSARMWRFEQLRLRDILSDGHFGDWPVRQRLLHLPDQGVVLDVGAPVAWPRLRQEAPLLDGEVPVGRLLVERSMRHVAAGTAFAALASTLLGLAIFFSVRVLPLRVVRATFARLEETMATLKARDQALAEHRRTLEVAIARRTDQLSTANARLERMLAELQVTKEAAEAASQAKSSFLAVMSHEIRTPMNAVLALAGTLLTDELPAAQRKVVETIRDSGDSLMRIINDILDYSKLDAGRMTFECTPFAPDVLTASLASILGPPARAKGLTLDTEIDPDLPPGLMGDAGRIRQVLLNLVSNAVKFTEHGRVLVGVRCVGGGAAGGGGSTGAGPGRTTAEADGPGVPAILEWTISDTGIGIPHERMGSLFDEFIQADASITRRFGGSGLGLAISKRLVELMGGTIAVESEPGQGTTMRVRLALPAAPRPAGAVGPRADAARNFAAMVHALGRKLRILLAEDNPTNQFVARQLLKGLDVQLDVVGNGLEAVEAVSAFAYDVVCMDMRMPEMDGLQATRLIRTRGGACATLPIVALTANAFPEDVQACLEAGMDGFLPKPVHKDELLVTVCNLVTARSLVSLPPRPPADQPPEAALDRVGLQTLAVDIGEDSVTELLELFVAETRIRLARLASPLDPPTCQRELHTLKGAAHSVCAPRLAALATAAEARLKAGGSLQPAAVRDLDAAFAAFLAAVGPTGGAAGSGAADTGGAPPPATAPVPMTAA